MMGMQFIGPIVASVLYVIVFQKAGFRGPLLAVCAAPLVGSVLTMILIRMMMAGGGPGMMFLPFVSIPLTLLPLLILAFKSWPPVGVTNGPRPEVK